MEQPQCNDLNECNRSHTMGKVTFKIQSKIFSLKNIISKVITPNFGFASNHVTQFSKQKLVTLSSNCFNKVVMHLSLHNTNLCIKMIF